MAGIWDTIKQVMTNAGLAGATENGINDPVDLYQQRLNLDKIAADAAHKVLADPKQTLDKKATALEAWHAHTQAVANNPLTVQKQQEQQQKDLTTQSLQREGFSAGSAAPVDPLSFAGVQPGGAAANPFVGNTVGSPATVPGMDPDTWIKSMIPGAVITSAQRSVDKNNQVHGVPDSMHLTNEARDFVLPPGVDGQKVIQAMRAAGMTEALVEKKGDAHSTGDHIHVGWRGAQELPFALAPSLVAPTGTLNTGPVAYVPPNVIASMMPQAKLIPGVKLPAAPQEALPADMPQMQTIDKNQILAPLAEAMAPVPPQNTANRPWDRVKAMLASAGAAAATAPAGGGMGQWLLRAGTGAAQGFQNKEELQQAEDKAYLEQARQAKIALAQAGFNIDLKNVETGNLNAERVWQSGENKRKVTFKNMEDSDQRKVQEILANHGVAAQNVQTQNQFALTGAQAQIGALEQGVNATNTASREQNAANIQNLGTKGQEQQIDTMLSHAGVDLKTSGANPYLTSARGTAAAILANNPSAALHNFAQEIVTSGQAKALLAPQRGGDPKVELAKSQALRALNSAKKASDPGAQQAATVIAQLLDSDHSAAYKVAQQAKDLPSAALLLKFANNPQPAAK